MIHHIVKYKDNGLVPFLRTKNYSTLLKLNYALLLNYVEDNIGVYTDEIILLETNTEEDIIAIVKLLERNVSSKCRYIQIIGNESFYVEDITSICLSILEEHKEYVASI